MPKSKDHWAYDLAAAACVIAIAVLVFWLAPVPAQAAPLVAAGVVAGA